MAVWSASVGHCSAGVWRTAVYASDCLGSLLHYRENCSVKRKRWICSKWLNLFVSRVKIHDSTVNAWCKILTFRGTGGTNGKRRQRPCNDVQQNSCGFSVNLRASPFFDPFLLVMVSEIRLAQGKNRLPSCGTAIYKEYIYVQQSCQTEWRFCNMESGPVCCLGLQ